jgi:glycosyltransferase involved in cell wall biosynthesis
MRLSGGKVWYWNCGEPWKYKRKKMRDWFERLVYRMVTYLVTGTEGLKREYAEHYRLNPEKIKVIPNWIDLTEFERRKGNPRELKKSLAIPEDHGVLLFVHRLSRRKGAHHLLSLARSLQSEKAILVVVGDGPERNWLESEIKKERIENKVRFIGNISNLDVPRYYAMADIFLLPSEEEGYPHVLLEAMASGVPTLALNVGAIQEIVPPSAKGYVVDTFTEFQAKLKELLAMPPQNLKVLGEMGKDEVQKNDLSKIKKQFLNLFS